MVVSTFDAWLFCFLFYILVNCVSALVLLAGGISVFCIRYLVLCTGAVVFFIGLCLFFHVWLLLTFPPSKLLAWILLVIVEWVVSLISFGVCCCW